MTATYYTAQPGDRIAQIHLDLGTGQMEPRPARNPQDAVEMALHIGIVQSLTTPLLNYRQANTVMKTILPLAELAVADSYLVYSEFHGAQTRELTPAGDEALAALRVLLAEISTNDWGLGVEPRPELDPAGRERVRAGVAALPGRVTETIQHLAVAAA